MIRRRVRPSRVCHMRVVRLRKRKVHRIDASSEVSSPEEPLPLERKLEKKIIIQRIGNKPARLFTVIPEAVDAFSVFGTYPYILKLGQCGRYGVPVSVRPFGATVCVLGVYFERRVYVDTCAKAVVAYFIHRVSLKARHKCAAHAVFAYKLPERKNAARSGLIIDAHKRIIHMLKGAFEIIIRAAVDAERFTAVFHCHYVFVYPFLVDYYMA